MSWFEFLNCIDEIVIFKVFGCEEIEMIVKIQFRYFIKWLVDECALLRFGLFFSVVSSDGFLESMLKVVSIGSVVSGWIRVVLFFINVIMILLSGLSLIRVRISVGIIIWFFMEVFMIGMVFFLRSVGFIFGL